MLDRGYQRPLFLAGPQTPSAHLLRKETFLNRWHAARGFIPPNFSVEIYDPQLAPTRVTARLKGLDRSKWPDVLVCENDTLAMGAIDAIRHDFGLQVPADIAVTGFVQTPTTA